MLFLEPRLGGKIPIQNLDDKRWTVSALRRRIHIMSRFKNVKSATKILGSLLPILVSLNDRHKDTASHFTKLS
jgi:hypothetical protein